MKTYYKILLILICLFTISGCISMYPPAKINIEKGGAFSMKDLRSDDPLKIAALERQHRISEAIQVLTEVYESGTSGMTGKEFSEAIYQIRLGNFGRYNKMTQKKSSYHRKTEKISSSSPHKKPATRRTRGPKIGSLAKRASVVHANALARKNKSTNQRNVNATVDNNNL
jgi:hypothetical protein